MCVKLIKERECVYMKLKRLNIKVARWLPFQSTVFPRDWDKLTNWFKAVCEHKMCNWNYGDPCV